MTSETEHEVPNPFLNPIRFWENYLINCIDTTRNFYENAIRTNERWLKAIWDPMLKAGNPEQRETVKVE
ncbi:MAG: hypothetical protein WBF33_22605 [Candidatus Nitrosopolaris sp.]|jgi:hypothetical protein